MKPRYEGGGGSGIYVRVYTYICTPVPLRKGETAQITVFLEMHVLAFIKVKRRLRRIEEFSSISAYTF